MKTHGDAEFWAQAARGEGRCLDPERLEAISEGHGTAAENSHLAACAACTAELKLFSEFTAADARPDELAALESVVSRLRSPVPPASAAAAPRPPWWALPIPRWALTMAALVLVAGIAVQLRNWREPSLRLNDTGDSTAVRSASLRILEPSGTLTAPPAEIRWETAPGAAGYRVRLLEVDGNQLWSGTSPAPRLSLPEPARALFVPHKTISIAVEARDASGAVLRSGTVKCVVKP